MERFNHLHAQILSIRLLDYFSVLFTHVSEGNKKFLAFITWFYVLLFMFFSVLFVSNGTLEVYVFPLILAALVSSLSLYVIDRAYHYCLRNLNEVITSSTFSESVEQRLLEWVDKNVRLRPQIIFSIITSIVLTLLFYVIDFMHGLPFDTTHIIFFIMFIVVFFVSQGLYWAILTPLIVKVLIDSEQSEIQVFIFNPNQTSIFTALQRIYSFFTLLINLIVTIILLGFLSLKPDFNTGKILIVGFWIVLGYVISFYTSYMPRIWFSDMLEHKVQISLNKIEHFINQRYMDFESLSCEELEELEIIINLHQRIIDNTKSKLRVESIISFLGNGIMPTIVAVIGIVDWSKVIPNIPLR
jgi:hypothetical protein